MKKIPDPKPLPYYTTAGFLKSVKKSSARREQSKTAFLLRKLKNLSCELMAYHCPVNSLRVKLHRWRGVNIGEGVFIGFNCVLDHAYPEYIFLDNGAMLAGDVYLLTHSQAPENFKGKLLSYVAPIHIKKGAWLGVRATIMPGVTVGEGAVVSAGAVVFEDVPDHTIVRGNPAEIIKKL